MANRFSSKQRQKDKSTHHAISFFFISHLRACSQAFKQIIFKPIPNILTVFVLAIAVALPSGLFLAVTNVNQFVPYWKNGPTISLYLKKSISLQHINSLQKLLANTPGVLKTHYISPAEGMREFSKFVNMGKTKDMLMTNPLPGVFVVYPSKKIHNPAALKTLFAKIRAYPNIDSAQLDQQWLSRLYSFMELIHRIVYVLAILFSLGVIVISSNTIRLVLQARAQEIKVLRLLGANKAMLYLPAIYQGLLYGLFAGIIGLVIIYASFFWFYAPIGFLLQSYGFQVTHSFYPSMLTGLLVIVAAMGLTTLGAWFSTRSILTQPENL